MGWAFGLLCGSVLLTWLYHAGGHSILLVALWHVAFNFTTGTDATAGVVAAISSTAVMVSGVAILSRRAATGIGTTRALAGVYGDLATSGHSGIQPTRRPV